MKKIVFFDIDGTLLDRDKNLPPSTEQAIAELKKNGVFVAIATGRAPFMFAKLREKLDIDSFVSFNGQYVVFENEVIYNNPLDSNVLEAFFRETKNNKHPLVFLTEKTMRATVNNHPYIEESLRSLKFSYPEKDPSYYLNRNIYQSLLFCEESEEQHYTADYSGFRFIRWHPYSVDVLPAGGSKAEGIKKLITRIGFELKDVYAFGDGLNDIEMLRTVGTSVAMGNGVPQAKKQANFITSDVSDNGILNGLKNLNLI